VTGPIYSSSDQVLTTYTGYTKAEVDTKLQSNLGNIVPDRVETTGNLVAGNVVATNTIIGNGANEVTIGDNLVVTGNLTVNGTSNISGGSSTSMFCGGRVNGIITAVGSSIGSVGYTVARASGQPVGVWEIRFNSPAPSNNYVISLTNMNYGTIYLWDSNPPNENGFDVVVVNKFWNLANAIFHFSVFV
jgi:hypothetical protein